MKYDVYRFFMRGFEKIGQVDAPSDDAAVAAAHAKWQGGLRLTMAGAPLEAGPPIGWPISGAPITDKEVAEMRADAHEQAQKIKG